jgi:hypothetical protein
MKLAGESVRDDEPLPPPAPPSVARPRPPRAARPPRGERVPLSAHAYARSGDKADSANIGDAARSEAAYDALLGALTPDLVRSVFANECAGGVVRYELPNLLAFNFVLSRALGGGGALSLRSDPQGKLFAQRLLMAEIAI